MKHPTPPPLSRRARRGQATTEWMLVVSVVVIAAVVAGYTLVTGFGGGMSALQDGASRVYNSGDLGR